MNLQYKTIGIAKALVYALLLIPYLEPAYFETISWMSDFYLYMGYFSILIISFVFIIYFIQGKVKRNNDLLYGILAYSLWYFITTILNGGYYKMVFVIMFQYATICLLTILGFRDGKLKFISMVHFIYEAFLYATVILLIIHPDGLYIFDGRAYTLIGHTNGIIRYFLPGLFVSIIWSYLKFKKIHLRTWVYIAILSFTSVFVSSLTSMTAMFIIIVFMIFLYKRKKDFVFNYGNYFVLSLVIFIGIVLLRMNINIENILNIFDKDMTFTGRTFIWERYINYISSNPIVGYGFAGSENIIAQLGFDSAHNFYLDVLYRTGLIGFSLMAFIVISLGKMLKRSSETVLVSYINIVFFAYFMMWNFEPFVDGALTYMFFVFMLAYCAVSAYRINVIAPKVIIRRGIV